MIILEVWVVIDCLFEVLWIIVDENGVLLDLIAVDFEKVYFGVFLNDLVQFVSTDLSLGLLFHSD